MKTILKTTATWSWVIMMCIGVFGENPANAADCAVQGTPAVDGEVLDASRWNTEWQNMVTCANARVQKSGGQMDGNLDMNGASITLTDGNTVDGEDVSALGNRVDAIEDATGGYVRTSGGTMNGNLDMNGADITITDGNTVDGEDVSALGNRIDVLESTTGSYLSTFGGTVTGNIFLNDGSDAISFFTNGNASFTGNVTVSGDLQIGALKKFYFDGGFDSFFQELADGRLAFYLNGASLFEFATSSLLSRRDFTFDDAACEAFSGFPGDPAYACKVDGVDVSALAAAVITGSNPFGVSIESEEITNSTIASVDLEDDAVTTVKIEDEAVTSDKIADATVNSIDIEDGTIQTSDLANGSVDTDKILNGGIKTNDIEAGAITSDLVADNVLTDNDFSNGSVGTLEIATNAVTSEEVADGSLTGDDIDESTLFLAVDSSAIADGGVTSADIQDGTIQSADLGADVIASGHIATGAIGTSEVANDTLTGDDIDETTLQGLVKTGGDTMTGTLTINTAASNLTAIQTDATVRVGGDLVINPQRKLYLDGDGGFPGGSDTYMYEKGSNWLVMGTAGVDGFAVSGGDGIAIEPGKKLFLDGLGMTGDTYLTNSASGIAEMRVDGASVAQFLNLTSPTRQGIFLPSDFKMFFLDSNNSIHATGSATMRFTAGGTETMIVSPGEVSIGSGIANGQARRLHFANPFASGSNPGNRYRMESDGTKLRVIARDNTPTERTAIQVDAFGNVGIGAVNSPSRPLEVGGLIRMSGGGAATLLEGYDDAASDQRWWIGSASFKVFDGNQLGIGTMGTLPIELAPGNTVRARFQADGKVFMPGLNTQTATPVHITATGELTRATSSLQFKENINDLEIDSSKVYDLNPVSYDEKTSGERHFGYIAEEVLEILPEMVLLDEDNKPTYVFYEKLSVLLLEELKKLKNENDENSKLISELMERLEKLESRNKNGRKPPDKRDDRDDKNDTFVEIENESESLGGGL